MHDVIVANRSSTIPLNAQYRALLDTGAEMNLIDQHEATTALHLMHIDDATIQTANGPQAAPVFMGQLTIPGLTYSKLHRIVGANLGDRLVVLGRDTLQDFTLSYSGRTGSVTLHY
jgi:predicted aspartyl protease